MEQFSTIFKGLNDETRLKIMLLLNKQSYCVCQLSELLELSQPKISKHLSKLKDLNLVQTRRDAQYIFYELNIHDVMVKDVIHTLSLAAHQHPTYQKLLESTPTCVLSVCYDKK